MPKNPQRKFETTDTQVGAVLNAARTFAGMDLRSVSELSGIDWRVLSRIERGERPCRVTEMLTLAKVYGVDYEVMVLAISGQKKAKAALKPAKRSRT